MTEMTDKNVCSETLPCRFPLTGAIEAVQKEIEQRLLSSPPPLRALARHLAKAPGKNIRAYSLLTCAIDKDDLVSYDAIRLAVAIEFLHLATLVHDDVIDDAKTRRGIETIQTKFGKRPAVICGDYLFCMALQAASELEKGDDKSLRQLLPDYMTQICLGEMRQNLNNRNFALTQAQYLKIIAGKTAALFEASFFGGFILSKEDKAKEDQYKKMGHSIGMIFQLTDDCADYEHNCKQTKKPVMSDYEQGVITLPLIYAFKENETLLKKAKMGAPASEIVESVRKSGGLIYTRTVVKRYYKKARKIIDSLDISVQKHRNLSVILDRSVNGIDIGIKETAIK